MIYVPYAPILKHNAEILLVGLDILDPETGISALKIYY